MPLSPEDKADLDRAIGELEADIARRNLTREQRGISVRERSLEQSRRLLRGDVTAGEVIDRLEPGIEAGVSLGAGVLATGGLPEPSALPRFAAGTAFGAGAAPFIVDLIRQGAEELGFQGKSRGAAKVTAEAIRDATVDLAMSATAPLIGKVARLGVKALGVGTNKLKLAQMATEKFDINLAAVDLSESKVMEFFPKTLGRFPILAGPISKQKARLANQIVAARDRMFVRLGPSANLSALGYRVTRLTKAAFKGLRTSINSKYDAAKALAVARKAEVPIEDLRTAIIKEQVALSNKFGSKALQKSRVNEVLNDILESLPPKISRDTPATIDIQRYEGIAEQIDIAIGSLRKGEKVAPLLEVKSTLESITQKIQDPAVKAAFDEADAHFTKILSEFVETVPAEKLARRVKGVGWTLKSQKAGTRSTDESFKAVLDMQSPEFVRELRKLLMTRSGKTWTATVRGYVDNLGLQVDDMAARYAAGEASSSADLPMAMINVYKRGLGVGLSEVSPMKATVREAFKGMPVSYKTVEDFVRVAEEAARTAAPNVNLFIARRVTLGGIRSLLNVLIPTAAISHGGASVLAGAGAILATRGFSQIISSPRLIKLATTGLDPSKNFAVRKAALTTLSKGLEAIGEQERIESPDELADIAAQFLGNVEEGIREGVRGTIGVQ